MAKFNPTEAFNFMKPARWNEWLTRLERYIELLQNCSMKIKKFKLHTLFKKWALGLKIYSRPLNLIMMEMNDIVSQKFTSHFIPLLTLCQVMGFKQTTASHRTATLFKSM